MTFRIIAMATSLVMVAATTQAASLSVTIGDQDCFGFGTAIAGGCADDTELPAINFDNSAPGDGLTDAFGPIGTLDFILPVDAGGETIVSAMITLRSAGINLFGGLFETDGFSGTGFFLNGTLLDTYFLEPLEAVALGINSEQAIRTLNFAVPVPLILDGANNTLRILPEQDLTGIGVFESYAIDYVTFSYETAPVVPPLPGVPVPASAILMLTALGLGGAARLRAKR